jgi:chromosome segregation ATPase
MKRPNKEEYERTMNSYKAEIEQLKEKLEKIVIPKDELNALKQEKRQVFTTLLNQKKDLQQKKNSTLNQIKQLQQLVKQKGDTVQKELEKLGYKSPDDVQSKVRYFFLNAVNWKPN